MRKRSLVVFFFALCLLSGLAKNVYPKIVYSSNQSGMSYDIWIMDDSGENQTPLTTTAWNEYGPRWSPDGKKIVYYSDYSGNYDIWIMDSDGSNQTQLTSVSSTDKEPTWTPDGSKILFYSLRSWNGDIWIMNSDGSSQTRLTYRSGKTGRDGIDVSMDGLKIVYTSQPSGGNWGYNGELYVSDIALTEDAADCSVTNEIRLSFDNEHDRNPRFTPDGMSVIWSSGRNNPYGHCASNCYFSTYEIFFINIDGTDVMRITTNTVTRDVLGSVSADGDKIFFYSDRSAGSANVSNTHDIWTCGINGGDLVQLTDSFFSEIEPNWAQDNGLQSPEEQIEQLIENVKILNLHNGITNSLDSKLDAAYQALDDINQNNDVAAINAIQAFINAVEAQSGKHITVTDAGALIAAAQAIIEALSQ